MTYFIMFISGLVVGYFNASYFRRSRKSSVVKQSPSVQAPQRRRTPCQHSVITTSAGPFCEWCGEEL